MSETTITSTLLDAEGSPSFAVSPTFLISFAFGFIITLTYVYSIKACVPAKTSRGVLLTAYIMVTVGALAGSIGQHCQLLFREKIQENICGKVFMVATVVMQIIGMLPFSYILPKSQLRIPRNLRPHSSTHIIIFLLSAAFTILSTYHFVGEKFNLFFLGFAIVTGYISIIGARLLLIAVRSTSFSIVKEGKVVGKLVRKEDGNWVEVEDLEIGEVAERSGLC